MKSYNESSLSSKVIEVTASAPCVHCGKPDWCYSIGELTACKRGAEPAQGWDKTSKADKDGTFYYAPTTPKKAVRTKSRKDFYYLDRQGDPLIKVVRIDDGEGKKSFPQYHWNSKRWMKGVPVEIQQRVPIYRYQQVRKAIAAGQPVFLVEGEGCADALWGVSIAATTTLGGSGKYRSYGNYLDDLAGADLVLCPDRDELGVKHMEQVAHDYPNARWLYAPPGDFYWQHLAKAGGLDTVDEDEEIPLTVPRPEEFYTQKACDALYGSMRYVSLNGDLYRWTGTHYELVSTAAEKARIAQWCNSTPVETAKGWQYAYAKASSVDAIWNWATFRFSVDPARLNPPGLNCLNGVLKISWRGNVPSWELVPHDPDIPYTYVGEFYFNPKADPTSCDRLLECLEPDQREIFIRTLAASLDLKTIRRLKSRIRALLCKGDGNNGKDSLKEVVQLLYGVGVVSATFNDFSQYENNGRKFTLAKLDQARVSWSSENSNVNQLDKLQSLKAAITGETLDVELKNVNERPMNPRCIFLFNINDVPNMQASLEAIQSRWAVLSFNKTFKVGADPSKGELEADPRFQYDSEFIQREVVPALLNKMLAVLPEVAVRAIDYSCTEQALQQIQGETNHLWAFARQVGLDYQVGSKVYINDLWLTLKEWYISTGALVVTVDDKGREKYEWYEQSRQYDKNVKAANQVHQRFIGLFPKVKRARDSSSPHRKGQFYLEGIGFSSEASEAVGEATALTQSGSEAGEAILISLLQISASIKNLKPQEKQDLAVKLREQDKVGAIASLVDTARAVASPTASLSETDLTNSNSSAVGSPIHVENAQDACNNDVIAPTVARLSSQSGDINLGKSTKNFGRHKPKSKLKVGDKCRAKRPDLWSVPPDKVLTIKHIDKDSEGDLAHVTFDGCRSLTGSPVLLSDLYPVEE